MSPLSKFLNFLSHMPGIQVLQLVLVLEVLTFLVQNTNKIAFNINFYLKLDKAKVPIHSEVFRLTTIFTKTIYEVVTLFLLWRGVSKLSRKFLRMYVIVKSVFLLPFTVLSLLMFNFGPLATAQRSTLSNIIRYSAFSILVVIALYQILVVHACCKRLKSPTMTFLHDYYYRLKELETDGGKVSADVINLNNHEQVSKVVSCKAFKKYILSPLNLSIDTRSILGQGEFGKVYKGTLLLNKSSIEIASKVPKESLSPEALEMILQEIQILIHIEYHINIIKFYGVTSDASVKNHIGIISELCAEGTLEDFLRKSRTWYTLQYETNETQYESNLTANTNYHTFASIVNDGGRSVSDLLRFSVEIARGMNHLASKKVIHGDLATRNVLLTSQLTAKISDFGISRRLHNYKMYTVLGEDVLLPWRWMSVEAIEDLKFSEKSDVWAFGVTLWEIFTLGETPFRDLQWTSSYALLLRNGTRLPKPKYSSDPIYGLMQDCWRINCDERPNISQLKITLEDM